MKNTIYIKLLGEGTEVFRSVIAEKKGESKYLIKDFLLYKEVQHDENWEFTPGSLVNTSIKFFDNQKKIIAISKST